MREKMGMGMGMRHACMVEKKGEGCLVDWKREKRRS